MYNYLKLCPLRRKVRYSLFSSQKCSSSKRSSDREEVTKEGDFTLNDDEEEEDDELEEWDGDGTWANDGDDGEGDIKDESAAYLEFLHEEVSIAPDLTRRLLLTKGGLQAQKLGAGSNDDDDGLEEESLLETPLDRVEPYGLFKSTLFSKSTTPSHPETSEPTEPPVTFFFF